MNSKALIEKFYTAFANGNSAVMVTCYHKEILFKDPAFGALKGERACKMWEMLLAKKDTNTKIHFTIIETNEEKGKIHWVAEYRYGPKKRKVVNQVASVVVFKEGKIIEHTDTFDLWKWTQQALGLPGYLLGWTSYMKNKIQKMTNKRLDDFISKI
ncbi:MAG: nuclear transport factor 2 family protein [Bacteroidota bacterium]